MLCSRGSSSSPKARVARTTALMSELQEHHNPGAESSCRSGSSCATSLTFVALEKIELWVDDYQLLVLHKKNSPASRSPSPAISGPKTNGLMKLSAVERTSVQIDATSH